MKKSTLNLSGLLILFGTLLFLCGCNKNKYQQKGEYQPAGNYGNANIIAGNVVTLNNWYTNLNDSANFAFEDDISFPSLTQQIVDGGAVMVYLQDQSGPPWVACPYSSSNANASEHFNFSFEAGTISIYVSGYDITPTHLSKYKGYKMRAVLITKAGRMANPNINYSDYSAVKAAFKLKD